MSKPTLQLRSRYWIKMKSVRIEILLPCFKVLAKLNPDVKGDSAPSFQLRLDTYFEFFFYERFKYFSLGARILGFGIEINRFKGG